MSVLTDGSLEVKLPTYGQMQQQLWEQSEKRESVEWRSEKRQSQRRERERARGKKIKGREKVEKSRNTVFFRCFVALEGRKVPLKRRVRSHLQGWKIMARSAFGSQHAKNASASEHLWRLRCSKSARDLAQSTCRRQHVKIASASKHFWMFRRRFMWQAQWILHLARSEQNVRVLQQVQKLWQAWDVWKGSANRMADAVQETCSSEMLGRQGADFLRGVAFWCIRSSGLLRWFCVTGAALRVTWHDFSVANSGSTILR